MATVYSFWRYVIAILSLSITSASIMLTSFSIASATGAFTQTVISPVSPTLAAQSQVTLSCNETQTNLTFHGTGTPGSPIKLKDNGQVIAQGIIGSDGAYTLTSSWYTFAIGNHNVVSYTWPTDLAGNPTAGLIEGESTSFVVQANCAPTHTAPTLNQVSNTTLSCDMSSTSGILFSGIGTPGATVTVTTSNGTVVGSSQVNASGSWWVTSTYAFTAGTYTLAANSVLGNSSLPSNTMVFTVAGPTSCTPAHASPTIHSIPAITLSCGETSRSVTLTGSGTPGATITVKNASGVTIATALVTASGTWSVTSSYNFAPGTYVLTVESALSGHVITGNTLSVTVNTAINCTPTIVSPVLNSVSDITLACDESGKTVAFHGTGTPGANVKILENGNIIAQGIIDTNGNWTLSPTVPFTVGAHSITVKSWLTAYPGGPVTSDLVTGNTITFTVHAGTCGPTNAIPTINTLQNVTLACGATSTALTLSGKGTPTATITVKNTAGTIIGTTTVDTDGNWSMTPSTLFYGTQSLTVSSSLGGSTLVGNTIDFTVSSSTNCVTHIAPVINPSSGAAIACGYTSAIVTLTGSGTVGATISVKNANGVLIGTVVVGAQGKWTLSGSYPEGTNTVTVTSLIGSDMLVGNTISFQVTPPVCTPVQVTPVVDPSSGAAIACGYTSASVTLNGTGTPGALITAKEGTTLLGTTIVGADGKWSLMAAYTAGSHSVKVTSTVDDSVLAGNTVTFSVSAPVCTPTHDAPVLSAINDTTLACGATTTSTTLSGRGTTGATITLKNSSGTLIGTTTVGTNGTWSYTTTSSIGTQTVTVTSTLGSSVMIGNTVSYTVRAATNCTPTPTTPTISVASMTLPCGYSSLANTISGTAASGSTIVVKDSNGNTLGTTTANVTGNWSLTTTLGAGNYIVHAIATLSGSTLESKTATFTMTAGTCGGGGSSTGPGGYGGSSTLPMTPLVITPAKPVPPVINITPVPRGKTTIKPYWQRFPQVTTPTTKFLGTGPSALLDRTSVKTSRRVETTSKNTETAVQKRVRFSKPLLGL